METLVRGLVIYVFLLVVLRMSGTRQFSEMTAFDLVLLLIIAETTQNALVGDQDYSLTSAFILILTLAGLDILASFVKRRFRRAEKAIDGVPVLLVDNGEVVKPNLEKERVGEDDILEAARMHHGLERLDQVKYAVLEKSGDISIVPKPGEG